MLGAAATQRLGRVDEGHDRARRHEVGGADPGELGRGVPRPLALEVEFEVVLVVGQIAGRASGAVSVEAQAAGRGAALGVRPTALERARASAPGTAPNRFTSRR